MPRNGSGVYSLPQPAFSNGAIADATAVNSDFSDIASTLTASIARDGQSPPTANLPMGNFKITGLAPATALADALSYGQAATVTTLAATDVTTTGNTVLGDAATDTLNVGNGGLVKDASGNTGIGTPPSYRLHVASASLPGVGLTSGNAASAASFGIGRTTIDGQWGVAGLINDFFNGTVAGDIAFESQGAKSIWFGAPGAGRVVLVTNGIERLGISSAGVTTLAFGATVTSGTLGYGVGAGGAVTQATSKSTGATLNTASGQITMNGAALAAATAVSFTFTNSSIAATDTVVFSIASAATAGAYFVIADSMSAGSCRVSVRNVSAGSLSEALVLNYAVIKAAAS